MPTHLLPYPLHNLAAPVFVCALLLGTPQAHSQSACSSDGQAAPKALLERFINADCDACWSDAATPSAAPGALALDWILPGAQGDDAPLAAAANRDALLRLAQLKLAPPKSQTDHRIDVTGWSGATLRVAHGPAVNGYLGASIELTLPPGAQTTGPFEAFLVMVETLPKGLENSPVPRNLARNMLQPSWSMREALQNTEQASYKELRPMNIPMGAKPERLRVVGWVQDAHGRVLLAAESVCPPEDKE